MHQIRCIFFVYGLSGLCTNRIFGNKITKCKLFIRFFLLFNTKKRIFLTFFLEVSNKACNFASKIYFCVEMRNFLRIIAY